MAYKKEKGSEPNLGFLSYESNKGITHKYANSIGHTHKTKKIYRIYEYIQDVLSLNGLFKGGSKYN